MNDFRQKGSGLLETPKDPRDFGYYKTFGAIESDLPEEYITSAPLKIKNQKNTDLCTAFTATEVSEDQEGVEFSPEWQFAKIKELLGDWRGWGADLRIAAKSVVKFGSLPQTKAPYNLENNERDYVANWTNWPNLENEAILYKKQKFFQIEKLANKDLFDSIRNALWQNKTNERSILTGSLWYQEWTFAPRGIIPKGDFNPIGLHAYKIFGWKQINGESYLMIQNSYGTDIGDSGIFYMSRETANKELTQGLFMFIDLPDNFTRDIKPIGNIFEVLLKKLLTFLNI